MWLSKEVQKSGCKHCGVRGGIDCCWRLHQAWFVMAAWTRVLPTFLCTLIQGHGMCNIFTMVSKRMEHPPYHHSI